MICLVEKEKLINWRKNKQKPRKWFFLFSLFTFCISCKLVSFLDVKIRVDFVLFGSIVVSAKINEFPMILGAIAG